MADKKISETTTVVTLPDTALIPAIDMARTVGDRNVAIKKSDFLTGTSNSLISDLNADNSVSHTGDTLETIVKTYSIPANTIPSECVISALIAVKKVGVANIGVFDFSLSGFANGLFHLVNMANNPYVLCERRFTVKNGEISCFGVSGSTFNDDGINSARFDFAFDVTVSNTFDLSFKVDDATDEMILDYVQINIL